MEINDLWGILTIAFFILVTSSWFSIYQYNILSRRWESLMMTSFIYTWAVAPDFSNWILCVSFSPMVVHWGPIYLSSCAAANVKDALNVKDESWGKDRMMLQDRGLVFRSSVRWKVKTRLISMCVLPKSDQTGFANHRNRSYVHGSGCWDICWRYLQRFLYFLSNLTHFLMREGILCNSLSLDWIFIIKLKQLSLVELFLLSDFWIFPIRASDSSQLLRFASYFHVVLTQWLFCVFWQ